MTGREALLLPCLGRSERDEQAAGPQFVTVEDSMGAVHRSRGVLAPAGAALRSEPAIVAGLAQAALGERSRVRWSWLVEDYDRIRDDIAAVIPGFDDFNARVRVPSGFVLPNPVREMRFPTASGRAQFTVHQVPRARARARAAAADHHPQPRSVQHDDLRPRRSLPRHPWRPAGRVHERGRHPRARAGAGR